MKFPGVLDSSRPLQISNCMERSGKAEASVLHLKRIRHYLSVLLNSRTARPGSGIQRLLPPVTALVRCFIICLPDARHIQDLNGRIALVHVEVGHACLVRIATFSEIRDVLLQRNGNRSAHNACRRAIVVGVGNISSMQRRWNRELVGVGLVFEGFVHVEGVAGKGGLGDDFGSAGDLRRKVLGRVQSLREVFKYFWPGSNGGKKCPKVVGKICVVLDER